MDAGEGLNISPEELNKLNPSDHRELQQFIANEGQKAQVQMSMYCTLQLGPEITC